MSTTEPESSFECCLSGKIASFAEPVTDDARDEEDLDEMPVGWIRVVVQRRGVSPLWVEIQKRKARQFAGVQAQIPPDLSDADRAEAMRDAEVGVDAAFFAIEMGTPKYIVVEDEAYVANPDADKQVQAAWAQVASALGVDVSGSR